ncbi:methylaspartate ammonia-lyase [Actinomadura sp. DC4]|uniref:methylaspartate ammonia-lyase n=1 Tax=Actinomadura sp. DC4 TaxID=3055069 RepID=UPI0025B031AA|nr:methylaspartate ammonia-lyase [Actinomadura sp. DC4]MDN3353645.1 methylaspartate ammonia-lyase [Actinomadura sp. DC4]
MRIHDVLCVAGLGAFPSDDREAIRHGAVSDGHFYTSPPRTPGYRRVRQPSESISVLLTLDDGTVVVGTGVTVQYAGVAGREPLLDAATECARLGPVLHDALAGTAVGSFRESSARLARLGLPAPVHYGVSQATLAAAAHACRLTVAETVAAEYGTGTAFRPVPIFAQCGENRHDGVDRMILRRVAELPHGLINNARALVGDDGELLRRYVRWVRDRILEHRDDAGYTPTLHFDCYGTIGETFGSLEACARFLAGLGEAAAPFGLRIEQPVQAASREEQIQALATLRRLLRRHGSAVELVADEWCNTLEDVREFAAAEAADMLQVKLPDVGGLDLAVQALLACRAAGVAAYCGGSSTETERSAQIAAGVAMGVAADLLLARPGMGVDEAIMVVDNEMRRTAAIVGARSRS